MKFFEALKGENMIYIMTGERVRLIDIFNGQLVVEGGDFGHMSSYKQRILPNSFTNPDLWKAA